jgi:G3E family GTPase
MRLKRLFPKSPLSSPDTGFQELMRSFLVRTNFVPAVRHVIGWRGLKESFNEVEGWTAKIKGYSGIFALYFERIELNDEWTTGRFRINYFPDPDEEMVEQFSVQGALFTQRDDYRELIRDFLSYQELCELFNIGIVDLCVNRTEDALMLGLESISRKRVVSQDGISLLRNGKTVEVVKPGGYDQDFPSYSTALSFFEVLAASVTFNLEASPVYLRKESRMGSETIYDSSGSYWENPSDDLEKEYLYLGYGKADFEKCIKQILKTDTSFRESVIWREGETMIPDYIDSPWWEAHKISDYKTLDKKILGIDDRPQLIVLTGFLGAGKTSFLQNFIEYQIQLNRFIAIIQNEIGETGLDGKLLDHDYSVTEIDEGCVCCTLVGNLKNAIHQILSRFHPDYIVLETTGLANPYNLLDEISAVDELVRFDSVTTIVDGINFKKSVADYEVARDQIRAADILLLNKKDLLSETEVKQICQKLRELNPNAPIMTTERGDINPALLYGTDLQDSVDPAVQRGLHNIHHSHEYDCLSSIKINLNTPIDHELFIKGITSVTGDVFRIKGIVEFKGNSSPMLFQFVAGRYEISDYRNPEFNDRFLILIGQNIEKSPSVQNFSSALSGR